MSKRIIGYAIESNSGGTISFSSTLDSIFNEYQKLVESYDLQYLEVDFKIVPVHERLPEPPVCIKLLSEALDKVKQEKRTLLCRARLTDSRAKREQLQISADEKINELITLENAIEIIERLHNL